MSGTNITVQEGWVHVTHRSFTSTSKEGKSFSVPAAALIGVSAPMKSYPHFIVLHLDGIPHPLPDYKGLNLDMYAMEVKKRQVPELLAEIRSAIDTYAGTPVPASWQPVPQPEDVMEHILRAETVLVSVATALGGSGTVETGGGKESAQVTGMLPPVWGQQLQQESRLQAGVPANPFATAAPAAPEPTAAEVVGDAPGKVSDAGPVMDQLQRLVDMHTQGYLTDQEFMAAKAKLLGL